VRGLARKGTAILISSSDLPELLALAHRIGVVREGRLAGLLPAASATEHALLALACGVAA
jgi:ABC-type sugar transport system ATPase subunit